jgi:hypothetical protein
MDELDDFDGTESEGSDESPVIQKLREQLKGQKAELSELRTFKEEAEARAQQARADAAEAAVNTLGFPGLKDDVLGWVEGDVTAEAVQEALESRGLLGKAPEPQGEGQKVDPGKLGQQVAEAAQGIGSKSIEERLATATSVEEITAIMQEAGGTVDYMIG